METCETIKKKGAGKFSANDIAIFIACVSAVALLSIPLVNLCVGIKKNSDTLGEYDTYVIGERTMQGTHFEDRIDDKGNIYSYNTYETGFEYEYGGKTYSLTDYRKSGERDYNFNKKEPIKIKSENPEQAVLTRKYDNTAKWIGIGFFSILEIIAVIFLCAFCCSCKDEIKERNELTNGI